MSIPLLFVGFHELASLFQAISLKDDMFFSVKTGNDENPEEDSLECDALGVPTDGSNLVIKALKKFREKTGIKKYFRVRLEKKVPHEAGLGGGSANAATALWAANELSDKPCTTEELAEFGAEFGSDVSFFLSNGTAYCTGRGEILQEIPRLRPQVVYVVKPVEGLSTAAVFKELDLSECSTANPQDLLQKMQKGVIFADFVNDLEAPSFRLIPRLAKLKQALYEAGFNVSYKHTWYCELGKIILRRLTSVTMPFTLPQNDSNSLLMQVVLMSGSGTSFFCLGLPASQDFMTVFPVENDVQIYESFFHGRRFEDMWYFQRQPLKPLKNMDEL